MRLEPVWAAIRLHQNKYQVGSNVTIPCVVTGHPPPRITWYRDDRALYTSSKYRIGGSNNNHTLTIVNLDNADVGKYRCEARNYYSESTSEIDIDVEGMC